MKYTVIWQPKALEELAELWVSASDPAGVTADSNRIDKVLERDPLSYGESRAGDDRLAFEGSLSSYFRVEAQSRHVFVLAVSKARR